MSRGFVKEEDQEEAPIIPPRAALPPGVANYVTPAGYQALLDEKQALEEEQRNLSKENETEHRRASMAIDGRLKLLLERIQSARVIEPSKQPEKEIRFGANIGFEMDGEKKEFQIVGVDEADISKNKIAFIAPIARALSGKKVGDETDLELGNKNRRLKVLSISYPAE